MDLKVLGGVLLILGTCLGGAILALPISNSVSGFPMSSMYLVMMWLLMTFCAFLILEVNLRLPAGTNLLNMAKQTIGPLGQVVTATAYFLLLYNLLAAYIGEGSHTLRHALGAMNFNLPFKLITVLFILVFGYIVFQNIRMLDKVNRLFIIVKLLLLLFIFGTSIHMVSLEHLLTSRQYYDTEIFMILCTSFGFGVIIPSLRVYLNSDPIKIRITLAIGSLIPLVIYLFWDLLIIGIVGPDTLASLAQHADPTVTMMGLVNQAVQHPLLQSIAYLFAFICLITSFLGIALSMSDFLSDSLQIKKQGSGIIWLFILTFLPPWILINFFHTNFIIAISYAGYCCVVLHILLPVLMAWSSIDAMPHRNYRILVKFFAVLAFLLGIVIMLINYL